MNNTIHGCRKIEDRGFFEKLVNERNYSVLDVRPPIDYRDGTLMEAPNAALRNFTMEFVRMRRNNNKIILIGSKDDPSDLQASIKYANNIPDPDAKQTNLSYVFYEEMTSPTPAQSKDKKRGR